MKNFLLRIFSGFSIAMIIAYTAESCSTEERILEKQKFLHPSIRPIKMPLPLKPPVHFRIIPTQEMRYSSRNPNKENNIPKEQDFLPLPSLLTKAPIEEPIVTPVLPKVSPAPRKPILIQEARYARQDHDGEKGISEKQSFLPSTSLPTVTPPSLKSIPVQEQEYEGSQPLSYQNHLLEKSEEDWQKLKEKYPIAFYLLRAGTITSQLYRDMRTRVSFSKSGDDIFGSNQSQLYNNTLFILERLWLKAIKMNLVPDGLSVKSFYDLLTVQEPASSFEPADSFQPRINLCHYLSQAVDQARLLKANYLKKKIEPFRRQNNEAFKKRDPIINERISNDMELLTEYWFFSATLRGLIKSLSR
jgi:hypothetical protein